MTLLLPTDGCEKCLTAERSYPVHPHRVDIMPPPEARPNVKPEKWLKAWYRCPRCRHSWSCGWGLGYADLPCPGCELCQAESGAA
jgi:hypothetical protein